MKEETKTDSKLSVWSEEGQQGEDPVEPEVHQDRLILSDLLEKSEIIRCSHRVRSCAFR